jgi:hypothetical protein
MTYLVVISDMSNNQVTIYVDIPDYVEQRGMYKKTIKM